MKSNMYNINSPIKKIKIKNIIYLYIYVYVTSVNINIEYNLIKLIKKNSILIYNIYTVQIK